MILCFYADNAKATIIILLKKILINRFCSDNSCKLNLNLTNISQWREKMIKVVVEF